jgi:hypothetical protein
MLAERARLVDVLAALSLTTDLATGFPFERGLRACLVADGLAPDATEEPWTPHVAGVPWLLPRRGHAEVAAFFEIVDAWKYERFEVLDMLVSDTQLAAEIRLIADLPNGNRIDEVVIHLWTFGQDGKVIALRRMLDTAANIAADTSPSP